MKTLWEAAIGAAVGIATVGATPSPAEVIEFTDKDEWIAAVGDYTTIDFTGHSQDEQVTDQYADLGVLFTDCCVTFEHSWGVFPNDGWGVDGNWGIHLEFDEPQLWIAADFPGVLGFKLYDEAVLIYETYSMFPDPFAGVLSDIPFDEALVWDDWYDQVNVDDLHFGVPAPGALPLLLTAFFFTRRRRA